MSTNRLESFSDGVIAVAITLLVLNLAVPVDAGHHLGHALGALWPQYVAYVISFVTIGIIWINHHIAISRLRVANHAVHLLNILLLMSVVLLPFATNLMARYLGKPGDHLAAAVYGGSLLLMSASFALLHVYTLVRNPHLLSRSLPPERRRRILAWSMGGALPYVVATALAPVSAYATLAITAAVAVFYASPLATGEA